MTTIEAVPAELKDDAPMRQVLVVALMTIVCPYPYVCDCRLPGLGPGHPWKCGPALPAGAGGAAVYAAGEVAGCLDAVRRQGGCDL